MNNAFNIPQRALILGAGSDIAQATALALADAGTDEFILAARSPTELDALVGRLHGHNAHAICVPFDATDHDTHAAFVQDVWAGAGHIDLVVVAFGSLSGDPTAATSTAAAVSLATTNYVGAVSIIETMVPRLRAQGVGTIVVISSVAAERPRADNYVYASSKAGLDSYARGLADALSPALKVLIVRPGFVRTKMTTDETPAPFSVGPERVAADIVEGLRRGVDILWSPPVVRVVMLGLRLIPASLHRRITRRLIPPQQADASAR